MVPAYPGCPGKKAVKHARTRVCVCVCACVCVHPVLVTGFTQPLQINDFITLYMLPFIPRHFLCTHFWQLVQHTVLNYYQRLYHRPHGHLIAFCITFCHSPLIIILVLFTFTVMPLFSTKAFHSLSLLIRSSSVSAITTRSSAYSNSHGKASTEFLNGRLPRPMLLQIRNHNDWEVSQERSVNAQTNTTNSSNWKHIKAEQLLNCW